MAISNDLFLAILAMDAYNRGYNAGMKDPGAAADQGLLGTSIGNATINSVELPSGSQNASFYAQSYTLDGKTVIAYRRTDQATGARAPIACITWGRFSPEVEQRYSAPGPRQPRLHPDDWTSGDQLWLVDIIGPPEAVAAALKTLSTGPFKNAKVRVRKDASDADTDLTTLLAALPMAAPSPSREGT